MEKPLDTHTIIGEIDDGISIYLSSHIQPHTIPSTVPLATVPGQDTLPVLWALPAGSQPWGEQGADLESPPLRDRACRGRQTQAPAHVARGIQRATPPPPRLPPPRPNSDAVGVLSARPAPRPASGEPRPAPPPPALSAAQLGPSWGPERPPPTAGRRRAPRRRLRSGPLSAALRSRDGKSGRRRRLPRPGSALLAGAGLWVLGAQGSCGGGAGGVPRSQGPARETPSPEAARPGCGHSLPSRRVAGFARGAGVELPRKPRRTLLSGTLELFC
ncbi:basic proline-rich protein-like [Felis catus]|uniref:basic proline-rich protein-like n=1 Tax=Felis catus TaxID=9685 RepID=UPI001D1A24FF|nr:basic proline-rich protein-like [Felis catus]